MSIHTLSEMKAKLTCYLLSIFVTIINGADFRCDYTYVRKANGWLKLHEVPANWHEARLRCQLEGSVLASPLNVDLRKAMQDQMVNGIVQCGVFTGIHATFSRGDFFSVEGVPLSKTSYSWAEGEPDNVNDQESCTMLTSTGELADVNCSDTYPYVCYKNQQSIGTFNANCGTFDNGYVFEKRTGSCYKLHKVARTWPRAYMTCAAEGGYLTIINSETEAQVIREILANNPEKSIFGNFKKDYILLGFHDWGEHGEFRTIEGKTLYGAGYDKFSPGEPNNAATGEFCGSCDRKALLNDAPCNSIYTFICEKSPTSLICDNNSHI